MKNKIFFLTGFVLIGLTGNSQSNISALQKDKMVQEVKEQSHSLMALGRVQYDSESLNSYMNFFDDQQKNAIPVIWVSNFSFTKNTNELKTELGNLVESRDKTPNEITEEYFFVLSENLVLEINKGTFSVKRKDGQDRGPFQMSNSTLWQKKKGTWRIIHSHQSIGSL